MAGLPGMAIPTALSDSGLPLGLQTIGNAFDEENVFKAGFALEQQANFTAKPNV